MINFNKNSLWNLTPINLNSVSNEVMGLLVAGEQPLMAFKTIRDQLIFTNKRIIAIDVQGITGKRKSFTSMPYSKVQFFGIQTPGFLELIPDSTVCECEYCGTRQTVPASDDEKKLKLFSRARQQLIVDVLFRRDDQIAE